LGQRLPERMLQMPDRMGPCGSETLPPILGGEGTRRRAMSGVTAGRLDGWAVARLGSVCLNIKRLLAQDLR